MTKEDAILLTEELESRGVICKAVEGLNLWAVIVYTGETVPLKWCSIIGDNRTVTWGPGWDFFMNHDGYVRRAAPAIIHTLPKRAFRKPVSA